MDPLPRHIEGDWDPNQMVDFSFCKRITEALEADEVVRIDSSEEESESEGSAQDMEVEEDIEDPANNNGSDSEGLELMDVSQGEEGTQSTNPPETEQLNMSLDLPDNQEGDDYPSVH